MASAVLYELRQSWKPLVLEIVWHALRKAVLYALAFAAVFVAAAYDYGWFAELSGWIESRIGGAVFSAGLCVLYVFGGAVPAIYIGITKGIAEKADRIGELIRQTGRPFLERIAQETRSQESIPLDALRRFVQTGDASALAGSLGPLKPLQSVAAALRTRPFRALRTFLESILKEFEMRGTREVTSLQILEAALPKLPDFVANELLAQWRTGQFIAWVCAAAWFALPLVLTHALR